MEDTGERFIPGLGDARITYEHLLRYLFAREAVAGKEVLDLGSGEGYGASLLAQEARQVFGLDIATEAVVHASSKYIAGNLSFLVGSVLAIPFGQGAFDAITCFEVIEHVADPGRLVAEMKRVLRTDGVVIVSTPNKKTYSDDANYTNPFHIKEFYLEEIRELLERSFKHVALYGEHLAFGESLWKLFPSVESSRARELTVEIAPHEFILVHAAQPQRREPMYFVAVCSDHPIPEHLDYRSLFLNDTSRLIQEEYETARARLQYEVGVLRQDLDRALATAGAEAARMQNQLTDSQQAASQLQDQLREKQLATTRLQDLVSKAERAVTELRAEAEKRDEQIEALRARFGPQERLVHDLRGQVTEQVRLTNTLRDGLAERERVMQTEVAQVSRQLEAVLSSRSWKVTAPLRRAYLYLQAGREKGWAVLRRWNPTRLFTGSRHSVTYDRVSVKSLTPLAIDTRPLNPSEALYWVPSLQIERQSEESLFMHPPARVIYRLKVPQGSEFRAYGALLPGAWGRNLSGVEFSVTASPRRGGRPKSGTWLIHPTRFRHHRRWIKLTLDLGQFADQEVELALFTSIPQGGATDFAWAVWGNPTILSYKLARDVSRPTPSSPGSIHTQTMPDEGPRPQNERRTGPPQRSIEKALETKLQSFLLQPSARLIFPRFPDPLVSIIIPTFDKAAYLYQCLESVLVHSDVPYEVIIVDDNSHDATSELLEKCGMVQVVRNTENLEFVRSCNRGASLARGRYILFLNNDVVVTPWWLSALVETIERDPSCGAVGAKLVRPNGSLQEAGSVVWADGAALGYGRDDDPSRPEYSYLRAVDYCSAACLLVMAELFRRLGGFDERYLPAYYEDADLCCGVWQLGYKVLFQPLVTVSHHEFGSRSFEGAGALMEINHTKFVDKWWESLQRQLPPGDVLRARDRRPGRRVLVMDDQVPASHLGLGLPRTRRLLEFLSELGYVVTFVPLVNATPHQPITHELQQLGIEVFYGDGFSPEELLLRRSGYYDIVIISRPHNAARFLSLARKQFPNALVVYDAEAIFCVREFLKAQLEGRDLPEAEKKRMLEEELRLMAGADLVTTVSRVDQEIILHEGAHRNVMVWEHAPDLVTSSASFSMRSDLLFVGTVSDAHPPNIDAVLHFATKIFPRIRRRLPDCRFIIVGANPASRILRLSSESVVVVGFVEDLREYYEKCRVFVVPSRFGAGISLKLIEAMGHGIPAVVSPFGASGLGLRNGREVLIADGNEDFADRVVELYEDEALWNGIRDTSQEFVRQRWSPEAMRRKLAEILAVPGPGAKSGVVT